MRFVGYLSNSLEATPVKETFGQGFNAEDFQQQPQEVQHSQQWQVLVCLAKDSKLIQH